MKTIQALVTGSVMLISNVALACSCALFWNVFPSDGSASVPTNVVVRAWYPHPSPPTPTSVTLVKVATQDPIEFVPTQGPGPFLRSYTPTAPLEPMTQYQLTIDEVSTTFTTGEGEDHEAPVAPRFQGLAYAQSGTPEAASCGVSKTWSLNFTGGDDAQTPREQLLVFAQTSGSDEVADATGLTSVARSSLGTSLCSTNFQPPSGSFSVALQVMDFAGNVSPRSTTKQGSSCASVPELFAMLALLSLRRRVNSARG